MGKFVFVKSRSKTHKFKRTSRQLTAGSEGELPKILGKIRTGKTISDKEWGALMDEYAGKPVKDLERLQTILRKETLARRHLGSDKKMSMRLAALEDKIAKRSR
jgi:hypothetical protein